MTQAPEEWWRVSPELILFIGAAVVTVAVVAVVVILLVRASREHKRLTSHDDGPPTPKPS